ncbi:PH domain-containing protein [Nocardia sp. NBC_00508]|uniref:PH domain-containing protein n=1 Tax=Nocardia sp. NBC_00508 TaxID=2975992 RepID=UPI002E802FB5|nr:PH domain-containing protein [Nocardia sp. NBC_00508]WUD64856.1 PH domain-containing protein [Nocardia sp. NBC_00508]
MIRIPRLAFLGVFILLMCVFFPFVGWPAGLWWLLLIPVVVLAWVLRTQTTVSDAGLDLRTLFGSRHLDWGQVKGVRIPKRGYVRADLTDGSEAKLPAVSYDRLRDLAVASNGRIPDPFAEPEEPAADSSADEPANTADEARRRSDGEPPANGSAGGSGDKDAE